METWSEQTVQERLKEGDNLRAKMTAEDVRKLEEPAILRAKLAEKDATLAEKDATLAKKDATLAEKDAEIKRLSDLLQQKR